ncbi:Carbon starvation protein A like protein [Bacillus licheniformis]|nr:Carbon starvation protein A like protein [Bacillus licheniformis]
MNAITIVIASICILAIAYRLYGTFMMVKVLKVDDDKPTPAHLQKDGKDYVPTNKWVSFGHHFAAIAAAGPLVGPILAAQFGYLPGLLWLLIGAVIGGAVHDIVVLFASMRRKGKSLSEVAKEELGPVAGFCTGLAMLFIITITMAGCRWLCFMRLNAIRGGRSPLRLQFRSRWGSAYFIKRQAT